MLRRAVFERECERRANKLPQAYIPSHELAAQLGWDPERFNSAVTLLEGRGLVETDETLGSAPFVTHGLLLTPEGWAQGEQFETVEPAEDRSDPTPHAFPGGSPATVQAIVALDPASKQALDVVADYFEANSHWIYGRQLRSKLSGMLEEKNRVIDKLVPAYLIPDSADPADPGDRYRLTLDGLLESRHGQDVRQHLGDVLDVLKAKAKRDPTFNEFTADDIKASSGDIAEAFAAHDYKWLDRLIRLAGLCAESYIPDDGGPWRVPGDIEKVLEAKDFEALRALRRTPGSVSIAVGASAEQLMALTGVTLSQREQGVLDIIAEYETTHVNPTPLASVLLSEPHESSENLREVVTALVDKQLVRMDGWHQTETLPLLAAGLVASKFGPRCDVVVRKLLAYLEQRLKAEPEYKRYTWEDLKNAGVSGDDKEFGLVATLIAIFQLSGMAPVNPGPTPSAQWSRPMTRVQLRAVLDLPQLFRFHATQSAQQGGVASPHGRVMQRGPDTVNANSIRAQLREVLAELRRVEPYPWSKVSGLVARAQPLVREGFPGHVDEFKSACATPNWVHMPRMMSGESPWDPEPTRDNFAEADAADREANSGLATEARDRILGFLAGLLAIPEERDGVTRGPSALDQVLELLNRFPAVARALSDRTRTREPITINDEYDVQYVLGALLAGLFDDVRPEEPTPSAGGNASRMDFLLKRERIVVETKFARQGHTNREITDELSIDKERYKKHPDCGVLVCFVYDPRHTLKNPVALEDDLRQESGPKCVVVVRPR